MKLMRRDPFTHEWPLSRLFGELPELRWPGPLVVDEDVMKAEEFTENGNLVIRAEMPGIDPDKDVDLEVSDGRLSIRVERRTEEETEGREYYRREMQYGILEIRVPIDKEKAGGATKIHVERTD